MLGVCMSARAGVRACACACWRGVHREHICCRLFTVQSGFTPWGKAWVNVLTFATVLPLPGMFTICNLLCACRACVRVRVCGCAAGRLAG